MCRCVYTYTSFCRVCVLCGVQTAWLCLDKYNVYSAPLERGYNRRHRFKTKVLKLVGLHSGPNYGDPVWPYLQERAFFLQNPGDVRDTLRNSKLKQKHYDNLRQFCDAFTSFSVEHCQQDIEAYLMRCFDELLVGWNRLKGETFFSYAWLLRYFLTTIHSPLLSYLKPKTCKRRDQKYQLKLNAIRFPSNGEIPGCGFPKTHFRCVR